MSEIYAFGDSVLKGIILENEKYKVCKNRFSNNPNIEHGPNIKINEFIKMYTEIIQVIKSKNKKPVLLSLPPIDSQRYMNKFSKIDITSKFLEQKDYSLFLCEDGIHPNEEGHRIISEAIQEHISKKKIKFN